MKEWNVSQKDYDLFLIARASTGDYSEDGYAALADLENNRACLIHISHCSCYGTFDYAGGPDESHLEGGNVCWTGTILELVRMAQRKIDPDMPDRDINADDYLGQYLLDLYKQVLDWDEKQK